MVYYILFPLIPIIFSVVLYMRNKKIKISKYILIDNSKIYLFIVLISLFIFSTFRGPTIGKDYPNYIREYLVNHDWYGEVGFSVLYKIVYFFFKDNYLGLTFVINIIMFTILYIYLNKTVNKKQYLVFILLIIVLNPYLYVQSTFNVIRQGICSMILLISYLFLVKKNYKIFLLFVLLASSIHKIGLVFLFLYFVNKFDFRKKHFYALLLIGFLINMFLSDLSILQPLFELFGFGGYTNYENSLFNFRIYGIFITTVVLFFLKYYDTLFDDYQGKRYIDLYILSLIFLLIAVKNDALYRVYIILAFITLPSVAIVLDRIKQRQLIKCLYLSYYILMYVSFLISVCNDSSYVPYMFV